MGCWVEVGKVMVGQFVGTRKVGEGVGSKENGNRACWLSFGCAASNGEGRRCGSVDKGGGGGELLCLHTRSEGGGFGLKT